MLCRRKDRKPLWSFLALLLTAKQRIFIFSARRVGWRPPLGVFFQPLYDLRETVAHLTSLKTMSVLSLETSIYINVGLGICSYGSVEFVFSGFDSIHPVWHDISHDSPVRMFRINVVHALYLNVLILSLEVLSVGHLMFSVGHLRFFQSPWPFAGSWWLPALSSLFSLLFYPQCFDLVLSLLIFCSICVFMLLGLMFFMLIGLMFFMLICWYRRPHFQICNFLAFPFLNCLINMSV